VVIGHASCRIGAEGRAQHIHLEQGLRSPGQNPRRTQGGHIGPRGTQQPRYHTACAPCVCVCQLLMCERIVQWHPLRPIIASISTSGVVYIWATNYTGTYLDGPCKVFLPANHASRPFFFWSITRELVGLRAGLHRTPGERGVRGARRRVRHCTLLHLRHRLLAYCSTYLRCRCAHMLWVRPKTRTTKARARNVSESMSRGRYAHP
jgi:hypothetical protein